MFAAFSCGAGDEPAAVDISGDWRLMTVNGVPADDVFEDEHVDIFMSLSADGNFETFQRLVGGETFVRYYGTWKVSGTIATGTYSDGSPWNAAYEVSVSDDGETLTMRSGMEECVYYRAEIPGSVSDNAIDYILTRSFPAGVAGRLL